MAAGCRRVKPREGAAARGGEGTGVTEAGRESLIAFAGELADAAGAVVRQHFRHAGAIDYKDSAMPRGQPVTSADREAEDAMRARIEARYPDHGIIGEEGGATRPDAPWQWVLDPIDGTRAFVAGFPTFGTMIGLTFKGRPVLGIVDQPVLGERFTGERLAGAPPRAALNGAPISCRPCAGLDRAVAAATDPAMFTAAAETVVWAHVRRRAAAVQLGGNCYAYALLAAGRLDLVIEADLKPWDVCALAPLVEAAGGTIVGWDGGPAFGSTRIVACGDRRIYDELAPLLAGAG